MSDVTAVMDLLGEEPQQLALPPGYRFHPTDEEVVTHYLTPKITNSYSSCLVVVDVNLNLTEPWHLPEAAMMGDKEWFFFVHKDRKYPTGTRTNRATRSGYWKATGKDKQIFRGTILIGMKKTLVIYHGRAPSGHKMSWVMHEYRLHGELPHHLPRSAKDDWAVCRVFNKDLANKNVPPMAPAAHRAMEEDPFAFLDELLNSDEMLNNADLLNNANLPMLMHSPSSPIEFTGAPASQHQSPNYMWKMMC